MDTPLKTLRRIYADLGNAIKILNADGKPSEASAFQSFRDKMIPVVAFYREKPSPVSEEITIEFDGGSSCNIPSQGYGKGYGSYQIDGGEIKRIEFGMGHSANSAEIRTLISALEELESQEKLAGSKLIVNGDSKIALSWANPNCYKKISAKSSKNFIDAVSRLQELVKKCQSVKPKWRSRVHSVALFGH